MENKESIETRSKIENLGDNGPVIRACSWCNSIYDDEKWKPVDNNNYISILVNYGYRVSHGLCSPCAENIYKEMEEAKKAKEAMKRSENGK